MNQISTQQQTAPAKRERIDVLDAVPLLDTGRFEHMQRVATVMARSTLMPESLYMEGKKDAKEMLPYEQILSNCFLVVNQAVRWGLDPFAVAQCVSVVHGKLCYEGKLVSAVLQAKMEMSLYHHFTGEGEATRIYLSDKPLDEEVIAALKPGYRRQDMRIFDGSVAEWKTTGAGTPWTAKNFSRMLIYRGTRDWCRIYEPALMLGVYTEDEMVDMEETSRFRSARNVTPHATFDPFSDDPAPALPALKEPEEAKEGDVQPHDALTGEILDTDSDDAQTPSTSDAGDGSPAEAPEQEEAGSVPSGSASPELFPTDRADLIDCATEFLSLAVSQFANDAERDEAFKQAKDQWTGRLPPELHDQIQSINVSARAVAAGKRTIDQARSWLSEALQVSVQDLGGKANG